MKIDGVEHDPGLISYYRDKKGLYWVYNRDVCIGGWSRKAFKKLGWYRFVIMFLAWVFQTE